MCSYSQKIIMDYLGNSDHKLSEQFKQDKLHVQLYIIITINSQMSTQPKAVEIYLRVRGPPDPTIKPQFKITGNKIRFRDIHMSEEEEIMAEFQEQGTYKFDKIYKDNADQVQIFNDIARDIVDSALQGFNGTIFAYGQTGSGKTYTMTGGNGEADEIGIIPRLINYLFKEAEIREEAVKVKVKYLQIYNQKGYDLLDENAKKTQKLTDLKEISGFSKGDSFDFHGLSEHEVKDQSEALRKFQYGQQNRIVRKTPMNDSSSRSHCMFMMRVITKNLQTGVQQNALINLVDLAGSQRIHNSGIEDEKIAKQGININLGLHVLSRVVMALGQQSIGKNVHIPYRDSLLTMALKSSMGGNCKTRMIATMNPNPKMMGESVSTCRFAKQLECMKNTLKKNQYIDPWMIIKTLKMEVSELRAQLEMIRGEQVKQALDLIQVKQIRGKVDKFLNSNDPTFELPLTDRLEIKEYLFYMKNIITKQKKGKKIIAEDVEQEKIEQNPIEQNYFREINHLKSLVQQRDNQINLLLNMINENKLEKLDDFDEPCLKVEDYEEEKIAEGVMELIKKNSKRSSIEIKVEDVKKNLIRPFDIESDEDFEDAFQRFKDSHVRKNSISEKQGLIYAKQRKKDQYLKKIQKLKHERAKLNTELMKSQENRLIPVSQDSITRLREDIAEIDDRIRKKYTELKHLQVQIDRISLAKNKNNQKLKTEFDSFIDDKVRRTQSDSKKLLQEEIENEERKQEKEQEHNSVEEDEVQLQLQDFLKARNQLFKGL